MDIRMNPIREFAAFEGKTYAATTRRVYLSAAKKALKILGKTPETCGSYEELLALVRESRAQKRFPKRLRIAPFVSFLDSKIPKEPEPLPDYGPLRAWVLERIEKETNATRDATHFIRRDLAMLACLCLEPGRGSPRKWAKTALEVSRKTGNFEVQLWGKVVQTKELILPLLYWGTWRERMNRPEQSRLHRKSWAFSDLLFPNSRGKPLGKQCLSNALARLSAHQDPGDPPPAAGLTPELIRQAFLQIAG
jgi:hypothetical protein